MQAQAPQHKVGVLAYLRRGCGSHCTGGCCDARDCGVNDSVLGGLPRRCGPALYFVSGLPSNLLNAIPSLASSVLEAISGLPSNVLDAVKDFVEN
jgi:hypothetical protein